MSDFSKVLHIFETRKYRKPNKEHLKIQKHEKWMDKKLDVQSRYFYCDKLGFATCPEVCMIRRVDVQHPTHEVCIQCPLGMKIESQTCVGHKGEYAYCKTCPSKVPCKSVTTRIKTQMQVSSQHGEFPAQEIQMPKQKAEQKTNKKGKPAEEEEEEDEDIEEEEAEDEDTDDEAEDEDEEEEEEEDEEDEAPAPKKGKKAEKPAKKGKGGGKGSGLVPREPIKVPKAVFKAASKEVRALLTTREEQTAKGDKDGLRKTRAALRKAGFNLSKLSAAE